MPSNQKTKTAKAFSLMELSMLIVAISILVIAVVSGTILISKSRVSSAQSLTSSSPVNVTDDLELWLEPTLDESFGGVVMGDGESLSTWKDRKKTSTKSEIEVVGGGPTYDKHAINKIHAIKFNNAGYMRMDGSHLNNSNYTVIVVERRTSAATGNFISSESSGTLDGKFNLGYSSDAVVSQVQDSYSNDAYIKSFAESNNKARIFVFTHSKTSGKKIYINGTLAKSDTSNLTPPLGIDKLAIGRGYTGEMGEVLVFARALKRKEIIKIEDYLAGKWHINITRDIVSDCSSGTLDDEDCAAHCTVSVLGSSETYAVAGSSGSVDCDETGYSGSISYNCSSAGSTITDTCACDTAGGYGFYGGECRIPRNCNGLTIAGSNVANVNHNASPGIPCDAPGYTGEITGYSCIDGSFVQGGDTCECDTAGGYEEIGGSCIIPANCTGLTITGSTATSVLHNSTSQACDVDGYVGNTTHTCINGTFNLTTSCAVAASCDTTGSLFPGVDTPSSLAHVSSTTSISCNAPGYSGTAQYTCNDGVLDITTDCVQECIFSGANAQAGITTTTQVAPGTSLSQSCNATGYNSSDSITFDCNAGLISNVSGSCDSCASGYHLVSGVCEQDCTIADGTSGITDAALVSYGETSFDCDETGYTGTITYSCSAPGAEAVITSNDCVQPPFICAGGTMTCSNAPTGTLANNCAGGKFVHTFTTDGTLDCSSAVGDTSALEVLVVGGGGGGGGGGKGGGGAGAQVQYFSGKYISATDKISITIGIGGAGGSSSSNSPGGNGNASSLSFIVTSAETAAAGNRLSSSITSVGGGGGGSPGSGYDSATGNRYPPVPPVGGATGGACGDLHCVKRSGNKTGGSSYRSNAYPTCYLAGGGASMTANGGNSATSCGSSKKAGNGANGTSNSISGTSQVYGSGGGGGSGYNSYSGDKSGNGGTNAGKGGYTYFDSTAAVDGYGGGGGGGGNSGAGSAGGSGTVIFSY